MADGMFSRSRLTPQQMEQMVREGQATEPLYMNPSLQRQGEKARQLINPDRGSLTDQAVNILRSGGMMDPRKWGTNIKFSEAINIPADMEYATAYVPLAAPSNVKIVEPRWQNLWENSMNKDTLAHEVEHSLAYTGGRELGPDDFTRKMGGTDMGRKRSDVLLDAFDKLTGGVESGKKFKSVEYYKPIAQLFQRAANKKIGEHIKRKYGIDPTYLGSGVSGDWTSDFMYEELAADLGMIMNSSKKNIFEDPFLQKELFNNDPRLMEAVRATLHVEPRMDAKDPQRLTAYPQNVEKFQSLIDDSLAPTIN